MLDRDVGGHVGEGVASLHQGVDEFRGALFHFGVDLLQGPRRKPGARDLADLAVLGGIHVDHHAHGAEAGDVRGALVHGSEGNPGPTQELGWALRDPGDIRVLDDGPERFDAGNFEAGHGFVAAQFGEELVGRTSLGVECRVQHRHSIVNRHGRLLGRSAILARADRGFPGVDWLMPGRSRLPSGLVQEMGPRRGERDIPVRLAGGAVELFRWFPFHVAHGLADVRHVEHVVAVTEETFARVVEDG